MIYIIYVVLLLSSFMTAESVEYKLINPNDSGEHYLTVIGQDIFYYGKVNVISLDSTKNDSIYFLSKAVIKSPSQNGIDNMMFYDFQYSSEVLKKSDFDSSKFNIRSELLSFDIYNSMSGELKGDTIFLQATKHIYHSRSNELQFIKTKR